MINLQHGRMFIISTENPFDILYILEVRETKLTSINVKSKNDDLFLTSPKISFDDCD